MQVLIGATAAVLVVFGAGVWTGVALVRRKTVLHGDIKLYWLNGRKDRDDA